MEQAHKTNQYPHLDVNWVPGGARQFVRHDSWFIMIKGKAAGDFNKAREEMVEGIEAHEGYHKVVERLRFHAKERGLPIAPGALIPPPAPSPFQAA